MPKEKNKAPKSLEELIDSYQDNSSVIDDLERHYRQGTIKNVPVGNIIDNHYLKNVRLRERLLQSAYFELKHESIVTFILVRKSGDKNEIVFGRKYLLAAHEYDISELPVVEIKIDNLNMIITLIRMTSQRSDRNIVEIGYLIKALKEDFSYKNQAIAKVTRLSDSQVANILRIMRLDPEILQLISLEKISFGHAKALANLDSKTALEIANKIIDKNLSVREVEKLVNKSSQKLSEETIKKHRIKKIQQSQKGLNIQFENEEALDDFLNKIK